MSRDLTAGGGRGGSIAVLGSVNLDLVARVPHIGAPGETLLATGLQRLPGGKGANQALAARRLGWDVALLAGVGQDAEADLALQLLREDGVDLSGLMRTGAACTGLAFIQVADSGENQIVVVPGANACLEANDVRLPPDAGALMAVLEAPVATVEAVVAGFQGFVAVNLAPALPVGADLMHRPELVVVNETELEVFGPALKDRSRLTAVTLGAAGAQLWQDGRMIAQAAPPPVDVVDTVGAGDTFVAALTVALLEGAGPQAALRFACAASALAVTQAGAQPSLPWRTEVDRLVAEESW
jgi:ribokinase